MMASKRRRMVHTLAYSALFVWILFTLFPIFWMFVSSLKAPNEVFQIPPKWVFKPTLHNYETLFGLSRGNEFEGGSGAGPVELSGSSEFLRYLLNSIVISVATTFFSLAIGTPTAYAFARYKFKGRNFALLSIWLIRLIPPVVLLIPIYLLWRNLHLIDTHMGLIIAYLGLNLPLVVWFMRGFFADLPKDLEEAGLIDGCSRMGAFARIILPLSAPGLAATAIFTIVLVWNEFMFAMMLTSDTAKTLSPAIASFVTDKVILWGRLYAAGTTVVLPILAFALSVQKHLSQGLTGGAVKG